MTMVFCLILPYNHPQMTGHPEAGSNSSPRLHTDQMVGENLVNFEQTRLELKIRYCSLVENFRGSLTVLKSYGNSNDSNLLRIFQCLTPPKRAGTRIFNPE